jgi:hypothetical protein
MREFVPSYHGLRRVRKPANGESYSLNSDCTKALETTSQPKSRLTLVLYRMRVLAEE